MKELDKRRILEYRNQASKHDNWESMLKQRLDKTRRENQVLKTELQSKLVELEVLKRELGCSNLKIAEAETK